MSNQVGSGTVAMCQWSGGSWIRIHIDDHELGNRVQVIHDREKLRRPYANRELDETARVGGYRFQRKGFLAEKTEVKFRNRWTRRQ